MKFRDKLSGVIYEPTDEVAAMMQGNPRLEVVEEPKRKPAARTRRKAAPKADETKE